MGLGVFEAVDERDVGMLHEGRETLFELEAQPIEDARAYLEHVARQWDDALGRLKAFVEKS